MASLDRSPLELCQRIFELACTDDGTTGRSLSLVSKPIRDISAPYKLQSICVSGAKQANLFVSALESTPPQHRRVSYLSISNDLTVHPAFASADSRQSSSSAIARATTKAVEVVVPGVRWYKHYKRLKQNVDHNVQCMQINRRRDESLFAAFLQILHLTAHTLLTLNVDFQSRWKIVPAQFGAGLRSLPMLTSLTVEYFALFHSEVDESLFLMDDHADGSGDGKELMPRLRFLDLAGFRIHLQPFKFYERITRFAPNLTHLRLPMRMTSGLKDALGLRLNSDEDANELEGTSHTQVNVAAYSNSDSYSTTSTQAVATTSHIPVGRLPQSLQRVYIQLSSPPEPSCCVPFEAERRAYAFAVGEVRELEKMDERVVVLDHGVEGMETIEDVIRSEQQRLWDGL